MPTPVSPAESADQLDPEIERFQQKIAEAYARFPPLSAVPLAEARRIAERVREPFRLGGPEMASASDHVIAAEGRDLRLRVHQPSIGPHKGALIYVHGGGWTIFSLDTHDRIMREYARRADLVVIGVDYALSPEAKFPVAQNQVLAAVRWVVANGDAIGVDPRRLAIGGDSAGANLAVTTAIRLRDQGEGPSLSAMVLNYGVFDHASQGASRRTFDGPGFMLTNGEMDGFWRNYLDDGADAASPLVSPINAELKGLPPAFMAVAACDILRDENIAFGQGLREAGVDVALNIYPGTSHSFLEAISIAAVSDRAFAETSAWLRAKLSP